MSGSLLWGGGLGAGGLVGGRAGGGVWARPKAALISRTSISRGCAWGQFPSAYGIMVGEHCVMFDRRIGACFQVTCTVRMVLDHMNGQMSDAAGLITSLLIKAAHSATEHVGNKPSWRRGYRPNGGLAAES